MGGITALLTSCASGPPAAVPPPVMDPAQARATIEKSVPRTAADRTGWAADMYAAFTVLGIEPTRDKICTVVAVTEQESGFRVDPVIRGLPAALSSASGIRVAPDGALLPHDAEVKGPGSTELAVRALGKRLNMGDSAIHSALEQGKAADFGRTQLYRRVFAFAEQAEGRPLPRALVPRIKLHGPKIARSLTTEWYALRVDQRFKRCLAQ